MNTPSASPLFRYEQLADRLQQLIFEESLPAGSKLPSTRLLARQQAVSLSTAFKTYQELESRGLIEARPRSGYYVSYRPRRVGATLPVVPPVLEPEQVSPREMLAVVYNNLSEAGILQLSVSAPAEQLLPRARLTKALQQALREDSGGLRYETVQGNRRLRQQLARLAFGWGCALTEDDVVTTHGCMEALVFCLKAVTRPGDTVAIESPTFFGIFQLLESLGLHALEIPIHPRTGLDVGYLEQCLNRVSVQACVFIPTFNNPLGCCLPDAEKERLVQLLSSRSIPLIEDDVYGDLYFGMNRPRTCKSFDTEGWVLYCSSMSKTLAPGYRVGWCLPGRFLKAVVDQKLIHTVTSVTPIHAGVGLYLEKGRYDLHLRHLRKTLFTQALQYQQAISQFFPPETIVSQPQGGYVLWVELPKGINAFQLHQQAIQHQISIAPGQLFSTDGRFTHHLRLSFGKPYSEEVARQLQVLGGLVKDFLK